MNQIKIHDKFNKKINKLVAEEMISILQGIINHGLYVGVNCPEYVEIIQLRINSFQNESM